MVMADGQLIEDFGFLKMYLRKDSEVMLTASLEGSGFYRQYTFHSTVEKFLRNDDRVKDEVCAVLFGSARKLANDIQKCLSEAGTTDEISGTYKYVPKASYTFQEINNLLNNQ